MANETQNQKQNPKATAAPAAPAPAAAKPKNGSPDAAAIAAQVALLPENTEAGKPARVRLASTTIPGLWVKTQVSVVKKYGVPLDPNGAPMVPQKAAGFGGGLSEEDRAARKASKDADKAKMAAMSPEQLAEFKRERREAKATLRATKKSAEREELIRQIKAEIEAGRL